MTRASNALPSLPRVNERIHRRGSYIHTHETVLFTVVLHPNTHATPTGARAAWPRTADLPSSRGRMFSQLVQENRVRRERLAADNELRKREAMASIGAATDAAMDSINNGSATVWHNQQQIEAEARLLHQNSQRLAAEASQWVASYQGFHQALKDLGDIENWARAIESDMTFISSSLDGLQQRMRPSSSSSSVPTSASSQPKIVD